MSTYARGVVGRTLAMVAYIVLLCCGSLWLGSLFPRKIQAQVVEYPTSFSKHEQTTPGFVPNTATDVWTKDVYLEALTLTNESASAVTCTIQDKQGTARAYFKTVSIAANTTYNDPHIPSRWFPGGLTWSCSAASAVTGYLRVSY